MAGSWLLGGWCGAENGREDGVFADEAGADEIMLTTMLPNRVDREQTLTALAREFALQPRETAASTGTEVPAKGLRATKSASAKCVAVET